MSLRNWGILQEQVYRCQISAVNHLKEWRNCGMVPLWSRHHWYSCQLVVEATAKVYPWELRTLSTSTLNVGLLSLFGLTAAALCSLIFGWFYLQFDFWVTYFPETSKHRLKSMWLCVCKSIFNLVKVYTCCCKIFRGSLFFWTQCRFNVTTNLETLDKSMNG